MEVRFEMMVHSGIPNSLKGSGTIWSRISIIQGLRGQLSFIFAEIFSRKLMGKTFKIRLFLDS